MNTIDINDFVFAIASGCSPEEAALRAGISPENAKTDSLRLLAKRSVRHKLDAARRALEASRSEVRSGLRRIAFGSINDAAALVFSDELTPGQLASADLFNVSELRRIKGGGVEIRFFDRQKALERLLELDESAQAESRARSFVAAVYGSDAPSQEVDADD